MSLITPMVIQANELKKEELQKIVVSASLVETPREASGSAVTVLGADYLEENKIRIVSDALRDVPGLAVNRSGGVGSLTQVRIRGAEGNQTLVLIDGIEVNDVASGSEFDFADLINLNVERIEVLRGAQSALWGSDAMGGVINIVTKKGEGPLNGRISVEEGSLSSHQQSFNVNSGSNRYHFSLSGKQFDTDGISIANEDRGNTEKDGYSNTSVNMKAGVKPMDNVSLDIALRYVEAERDTDAFVGGVGATDADGFSEKRQKFGKFSANVATLDDQWLHKLEYSYGDTDNKSFGGFDFFSQGEKRKVNYQTDFFLNRERLKQRLTLAAEREEETFASQNAFSDVDRTIKVSGFIAEYGININDIFYSTIAARHDDSSLFENTDTYRLTLASWLTENIRSHASIGTGIKNPTAFELFGSSANFTGNADLRPEENSTWDAGIEYYFESIDGYIDLTYFYSDVDNLIIGSGTTSVNQSSDSTIEGIELSAVLRPSNDFRINANYTYTDTNDGDGNELVRRAKHIASINSSYLFSDRKTQLTGGIQYNGKQDDFEFDAFFNRTQVTLDDYTLVNVALSHKASDSIELYARIDNLFDEEYEEVLTYGTPGINGTIGVSIKGDL